MTMIQTELADLRPADQSVASILDALSRTAGAQLGATQRREAAEAARAALLTGGATGKQRGAADDAINDAGFEIEQLQKIEAELREQLSRAREAEAGAAIEQSVVDAIEAEARWAQWFSTEYAELAQRIAEGLAIERAAIAARTEAMKTPATFPRLPARALGYCGTRAISIAGAVRLPATEPGTAPIAWGKTEIF